MGWPGLIVAAYPRRRPRLHHVDELGADRLAVDHRRRVFGLRRDERDGRRRSAGQLSQTSPTRSPIWTSASRGSGTKNRTKIFSGGSSDTTGAAGGDGLAGPGEDVGDDAADRRGDVALVEPPLQTCRPPRATASYRRLLRLDLALAPERRAHLGRRRFEALDLGIGRAQVGALLVDELDRHRVRFHQGLVAPEIGLDLVARGLGVRPDWLPPAEFRSACRSAWRLASCSSACRSCRVACSLAARSAVSSCSNRAAPGATFEPRWTARVSEQALLGRPDLDVVGLGIALPLDRRRSAVLPPPAGACRGQRRATRLPLLPNGSWHLTYCNRTVSLH